MKASILVEANIALGICVSYVVLTSFFGHSHLSEVLFLSTRVPEAPPAPPKEAPPPPKKAPPPTTGKNPPMVFPPPPKKRKSRHNDSVLVVGGAGFLGFHLCQRLVSKGWSVMVVDSFKGGKEGELEMQRRRGAILERDNKVQLVEADLLETDTMVQLFKDHDFRMVVHLVQREGMKNSELNRLLIQQTFNLCSRAQFAVDGLIWVSPHFGFAVSRYSGETTARRLFHMLPRASQLQVTMLRLSIVYGDYGRVDMPYLYDMVKIKNGQAVAVFSQMEVRLEYVHVDDFTAFVVRVFSYRRKAKMRVIDVGVGYPAHDHEQLVKEMSVVMNKTVDLKIVPNLRRYRKDEFARPSHLDAGFNKSIPLRQGLAQVYRWFCSEYY